MLLLEPQPVSTKFPDQKSRFIYIRDDLGLSQKEMAQKLGLKTDTYKYYEYNNGKIRADMQDALMRNGINERWLRKEEGSPYVDQSQTASGNTMKDSQINQAHGDITSDSVYKDKYLDCLEENRELTRQIEELKQRLSEK